jgi:hypothetical protein
MPYKSNVMTTETREPFLLNPRSANVAAASSRRLPYSMSNGDYHPFIGCMLLVASGGAGFFLLFIALSMFLLDRAVAMDTRTAQAVITNCSVNGSTASVEYRYAVDGGIYDGIAIINQNTCDGYTNETTLEIAYVNDDPTSSTIPGYDEGYTFLAIMGVVGIGLCATAAFVLYRMIRTQQDFSKLESQGVILHGKIREVQRGYRSELIIYYFFTTPDGKTLHGKSKPEFALAATQFTMPRSGMQITVLYADDQCFRVL